MGPKGSARWRRAAACASVLLMFTAPSVCLAEEAQSSVEPVAVVVEAQDQAQAAADTTTETPVTDAAPTETEQTPAKEQSTEDEQASEVSVATDTDQQAVPVPSPAAAPAAPASDAGAAADSTAQSSSDNETTSVTSADDTDPQDGPLTGIQYIDGDWHYYDESGNPATGWYTWEDGTRSYFENGDALTDFNIMDDGVYYFDPDDRHSFFKWVHYIDDFMYYFDGNGHMWTGWLTWKADKTRSYFLDDGTALSGWDEVDGETYYFDPGNWNHGLRWLQKVDDKSYYFDSDCHMVTGWVTWNADKTRSYFEPDGDSEDYGAALSGWRGDGAKRYYIDPSTLRTVRWAQKLDDKLYYFDADCHMWTGWLTWAADKSRSYFGSDGAAVSGWKADGVKRYYISPSTLHTVRWLQTIDDKMHYFDGDYTMHTGWVTWNSDKTRSYFGADGIALSGWRNDGAKRYYIDPKTLHTVRWLQTIDGKMYYFDADCHMHTGWVTWNADKSRSYFGSDGVAVSGWKNDGKKRYYIDPSTLHTVRWAQTIDGRQYYFDGNYVMYTGWLTWQADGSRTYFNADWRMANYGAALPIVSEKNRTRKSIEALCRDAIYWVTEGNLGYDQAQRYSWQHSGYREGTEVDYSAFVIGLLRRHGFSVGDATYTGDMRSNLRAHGWKVVKVNGAPRKGDILLNDGDHTALYVGDGMVAQASRGEAGHSTYGGKAGNQDGYETNLRGYYNYPWSCYLRYVG